MELIIQILIFFILLNCILKLSFWKTWQTALFGLLCALFVWFSQSVTVTLFKTQLEALLHSPNVLQDLAVLITAESAICFGFWFLKRNKYTKHFTASVRCSIVNKT